MQGIYTYIPETNHVPREHRVAAILVLDSSWNVMAHGDAREGKWRGNWRMEWVASTLYITSEHVSSITIADAHTSAASSRLNWRPRRLKWTRPFRRKTNSGFCACAITFQLTSTIPGARIASSCLLLLLLLLLLILLILLLLILLLLLLLLLLLTAIELSLGGSSPYTSTDKTNKNKYT